MLGFRRRATRPGAQPVHDVVTPTPMEAARADQGRRRRRYGLLMGLCLTLVVFGFFVTAAPVPVRLVALAVAAVLPPMAAIAGNAGPNG